MLPLCENCLINAIKLMTIRIIQHTNSNDEELPKS